MERTELAQVIVAELEHERAEKIKELTQAISAINARMEELTRRIENNGPIPSTGQVQSLGNDLDRLCGQIATLQRVIDMIPGTVEHAEYMQIIQSGRKEP